MALASATPFARRTNSSTSLAQFYQEQNANFNAAGEAELQFCNAFWGTGDKGYDVLMARLRATGRTMDDMKAYWKERASIEEDYAKRLSKLAKAPLGRDEIGDLRAALESLREETEKQAAARSKLALEIKRDIEGPTGEFVGRLSNLKKTCQANIEKSYKNKTIQEGHVAKARERYEQDCLRINSFTANSSIVQGKELDKLQKQLEKVNLSVGGNERDYRNYVKMLEETTRKWEGDWKGFCDHVQDLEEERLDFIKDNVWVYANAVSSVCVTDDESCERIRVSLEGFETSTEMETFVRNYGTGAKIPDPPPFVDYSRGEAYSHDVGFRMAHFHRTTARPASGVPSNGEVPRENGYAAAPQEIPPPVPERDSPHIPTTNGYHTESQPQAQPQVPPQREHNGPTSQSPFGGVPMPGMVNNNAASTPAQRSESPAPSSMGPPAQPSYTSSAPTVRPPSAFARPPSAFGSATPAPTGPAALRSMDPSEDDDPIARSLAELRRDPPPAGSIKRGTSSRRPESSQMARPPSSQMVRPPSSQMARPPSAQGLPPPRSPGPASEAGSMRSMNRQSFQGHAACPSMDTSLVPPAAGHTAAELAKSRADHDKRASRNIGGAGAPGSNQDFNSVANDIVGAHPASRPSTPSGQAAARAPSPAFMQPPNNPASPLVDEVVGQYHQAFPGERSRGPSRSGSVSSRRSRGQSISVPPTQSGLPASGRSPSPAKREGFVGIGAGTATLARSPSPQPPAALPSTGSWNGQQQSSSLGMDSGNRSSIVPPPVQPQTSQSMNSRTSTYAAQASPVIQHAPQGASFPGRDRQTNGGPPQAAGVYGQNQYGSMGQNTGYGSQNGLAQYPSQPQFQQPPPTAAAPSPQPGYPQQYPQQPQQQPPYHTASPTSYAPPPQAFAQQAYPQQQPPPQTMQHQQSYPPPQSQQPPPQPQHQNSYPAYGGGAPPPSATTPAGYQYNHNQYARAASPAPAPAPVQQQPPQQVARAPSPAPPAAAVPPVDTPPTGQYSTQGAPILFFKALYDYRAESEAEFDFQSGDIIAVTHTPPDGWWSGELLDEARRQPGKNDFPSNFVCLF